MAEIDVVIPNYNYGRYLGSCLRSIQQQDLADIRILVLDNASTDDSIEIARSFAQNDPRIEIIANEVNLGSQANFNKGLACATAPFLTFLCADDWLPAGALRKAVDALLKTPSAAFAIGSEIHILGEDAPLPADALAPDAPWNEISGHGFVELVCQGRTEQLALAGIVMRTEMQRRAGHFDSRLKYYDDMELALRLATFGSVLMTSACLTIRRMHGANLSAAQWTSDLQGFDETHDVFEVFFGNSALDIPDRQRVQKMATTSLAARAYWRAVSELLGGNRRRAAVLFRFAIRLVPHYAVVPPWDLIRGKGGARHLATAALKRLRRSPAPSASTVRIGNASEPRKPA